MKFRKYLILVILSFVILSLNAQRRMTNSGFDIDEIKKEKANFLKKELNLTEAEAKAFIPLESEFMTKKFAVNREARRETRALEKKETKTEADYKRITQLNLESEQKEAQLSIEYYKKFSEVLSAEKIERYRSADLKFKEIMLKRRQAREQQKEGKRR